MTSREKYIVAPAVIFGIGAFVFKYFEQQYFSNSLTLEIYLLVIGIVFLLIGLAIGITIRNRNKQSNNVDARVNCQFQLTQREYEVLDLIARGYSNKEIGEKLFLSVPTIKSHTSSLYAKLDVQRRTQAVKKAKDLKILEG